MTVGKKWWDSAKDWWDSLSEERKEFYSHIYEGMTIEQMYFYCS